MSVTELIAEFDDASDALLFARAKFARDGREYHVTSGISRRFAVTRERVASDVPEYLRPIPMLLRRQAS